MSKKSDIPVYGILNEADIGMCPSCKKLMAMPRFMNLDKLHNCPQCGASSYGYKWQSDKGYAAFKRMQKFSAAMKEDDNDKK